MISESKLQQLKSTLDERLIAKENYVITIQKKVNKLKNQVEYCDKNFLNILIY